MNQRRRSRLSPRFIARRLRRILFRRAQAAARWTALAIYLFLSLGIQLPLPAAKTSGEPYPCMNHPCGCATAEQCWRHCCCTTLEQRLAWARENHVTPPISRWPSAAHGIDWEAYCTGWAGARIAHLPRRRRAACRLPASRLPCSRTTAKCNTRLRISKTLPIVRAGHRMILRSMCQGSDLNWVGLSVSLPPPAETQLTGPPKHCRAIVFADGAIFVHLFRLPRRRRDPRPLDSGSCQASLSTSTADSQSRSDSRIRASGGSPCANIANSRWSKC